MMHRIENIKAFIVQQVLKWVGILAFWIDECVEYHGYQYHMEYIADEHGDPLEPYSFILDSVPRHVRPLMKGPTDLENNLEEDPHRHEKYGVMLHIIPIHFRRHYGWRILGCMIFNL